MQKYQNNIQNQLGDEITGATIEVRDVVGGALSTLFSDDGATALANPFVAQDGGEFFFYAANARYNIGISGPVVDSVTDVLLYDPTGGGGGGVSFPLDALDNEMIRFGTGIDMLHYFDGVDGRVDMVAGDWHLRLNSIESAISAVQGGAVSLSFNDAVKFATNILGANIENVLSVGGIAGGSVYMQEAAAAKVDVVSQGQFWVRNDVPNLPMFTDDAGTDFVLNNAQAPLLTGAVDTEMLLWDDVASAWTPAGAGILASIATAGTGQITVTSANSASIQNAPFYVIHGAGQTKFLFGAESTDDTDTFGIEWALAASDLSERVNFVWASYTGTNPLYFRGNGDVGIADDGAIFNTFGSMSLIERANADADVAGRGQFWVRNDAPNAAMFTDDTGIDYVLSVEATATTAQLTDIAAAINTTPRKIGGFSVYNSTTGAPVWAFGATAAAVWNDATGATAHTPV